MKLIPTNLIEEKNIKERNEEYTIFVEYRDYFTKSFSFKTRSKKISVEFIFNRDEEKYSVEIIHNIQDYDKKVRDDFKALVS